jgi:hypothetical protein
VADFDALKEAASFEDSYLHLRDDPQLAVRHLASVRGGQLS